MSWRHKRPSDEAVARAELAALKSQLSFFSGSYADSLSHAEAAMAIADAFGALALRVFVRRAACMVLGTVGVPGWAEWLQETLALSIAAGDGEILQALALGATQGARPGSRRRLIPLV
jgi:glutathione S-transferase